jgi:poly(glycerol-phosphate) alpha-glucosyltransferase
MKIKQGALVASISRNAGGLFHSVRQLSLAMNALPDVEVEVFGLMDQYAQEDLVAWDGVKTHLLDQRGPRIFGYAPKLRIALSDAQLDVLHVHGIWMYPSVASRRWAAKTGKPYMVSPHGMLDPWAVRNSGWKKRLAGWLYEDAHLQGAACVRALSESEAQAIRGYGLRNPICIIPNGMALPDSAVSGAPPWQGKIPAGAKVLLYLGRLHPKKGLPILLKAWAAIRESGDLEGNWHLAIAGWDQGGHEQELRTLADDMGIKDSVHFVGPQFGGDKHACYSHADAFILPSFSEGLPMVILEAWAYGLPVVMTPQCNLPEGFASGAAVRVEAEADSIASGLIGFLALADHERKAMGARGRQLVEDKFAWARIAEQMLSVYRWVLGGGAKPGCVITD